MPTYQYLCRDCGHGFDQFQKFSEDALTDCPSCEGTVQRVIQNVGVVFKGSGWYITDSRNSTKSKGANDGSAPADVTKSDSTDTKPIAAADSTTSAEKATTAPEKAKPAAAAAAN